MNYKHILFVCILIPFTACKGQEKCDELYNFIFTNTGEKNVYSDVHSMGKDVIPCLISFIDRDKKSVVGFQDPKSSTIHSFTFKNYIGIKAAYLIEFILSKDTVESVKSNYWEQQTKPYNLFGYSIIVRTENDNPILKPLDYEDMKVLKGIYLKWWQLNKGKSIEVLRKEWKENKRILNYSKYKWI